MLDPIDFGKAMASIVNDATAPLLKRIQQLESRQPIKGDKGDPGERGENAPGVTDEQIHAQVAKYLSANPPVAGERGEPGERGEKGADGSNGKDANPIDVPAVLRGLIESDDLLSLVELRVKEEVTRLPTPKDGQKGERGEKGEKGNDGAGVADLLIDRSGSLVATMTDGRMKSLGVVCGTNGNDGERGTDGKDGADFSGFDVDYDGERTLRIRGTGGEIVKRLPIPMDRGYWRAGSYEKGDVVTEGGTAFIAQKDTKDKPSLSSEDWRIFARKGRDGKDGRNGIDKTHPTKLKDSVDA